MKCPNCHGEFPLTWRRYFRFSGTRLSCPLCNAGLRLQHHWPYFVLTPIFVLALMTSVFLLTVRPLGVVPAMFAMTVVALAIALPVDRFADSRVATLVEDGSQRPV